jgi:hypothetical protein
MDDYNYYSTTILQFVKRRDTMTMGRGKAEATTTTTTTTTIIIIIGGCNEWDDDHHS